MSILWLKLVRLVKRFFTSLHNQAILKENRVVVNGKLTINGKIIVKNKGTITIGNGVLINNHSAFNPVGLPHQTILATLNGDAIIKLGNNVGISGSSIVSATSIIIGNNVLIGGGVGIWDTDFHPIDSHMRGSDQNQAAKTKSIIIADNVFIGARSIILKGVKIGTNALVAAGTVVNKDVPEGYMAFGNPMNLKSIIDK